MEVSYREPGYNKVSQMIQAKACLFGEKQGLHDCRDGGAQKEWRG